MFLASKYLYIRFYNSKQSNEVYTIGNVYCDSNTSW